MSNTTDENEINDNTLITMTDRGHAKLKMTSQRSKGGGDAASTVKINQEWGMAYD